MKKIFILLTAVLFGFGLQEANAQKQKGVVINGVTWATCNVDAFRKFAAAPESAGMFYQWNQPTAWAAKGKVKDWDDSFPINRTWEAVNDPCPSGWHVPSITEIKTLLDTNNVCSEWVKQNGVNGRIFTDISTNNSIFLPAVGYRYGDDGKRDDAGKRGYYWSCAVYDHNIAHSLVFGRGGISYYGFNKTDGYSVRCVLREETITEVIR